MESHIDQEASALGCEAQNEQPLITVTNRANKRRQRSSQAVTPQQQLIVTLTNPITLRQNRPTVHQPKLPLSLLMITSSQYGRAVDYNSAR
ncbi:hypothetical protein HPB48_022663 [Haemaphysalis longicornis]|uniref:Uncharacterized protein n=1 Tax=Haemaphysalis longicornis TaxID=44386 RepID=A0A9J6FP33_HAELO|nr:hypothetical protein HPB48_022663 [Haemaphysalis longicornis]